MLKLNFEDNTDVDEKHRGATSAASRALLLLDATVLDVECAATPTASTSLLLQRMRLQLLHTTRERTWTAGLLKWMPPLIIAGELGLRA